MDSHLKKEKMEISDSGSVNSVPGFRALGLTCGIKQSGEPDLGVLLCERPCNAAGVFTTNRVKAGPVIVSKKILKQSSSRIQGLVVNLGKGFESIEQGSRTSPNGFADVTAGAGVLVRQLGRYAIDHGLSGLNFALGIPGTVGGALRMNAGAWGACMADTTSSICVLNRNDDIVTMGREELLKRSISIYTVQMGHSLP